MTMLAPSLPRLERCVDRAWADDTIQAPRPTKSRRCSRHLVLACVFTVAQTHLGCRTSPAIRAIKVCVQPECSPAHGIATTYLFSRKHSSHQTPQPKRLMGLPPNPCSLRRPPLPLRIQRIHLSRGTCLVRSVHQHRLGPRYHRRLASGQGSPPAQGLLGPCSRHVGRCPGLVPQCLVRCHYCLDCLLGRCGRVHRF